MKDKIFVRVVDEKGRFFVDYSKDKKSWSNYSAQRRRNKATRDIKSLQEVYCVEMVIA